MTIYIDTTISKVAKIELRDGPKVFDQIEGQDALVLIDKLLKRNNLSINKIEKVGINEGPGSFTGLRVAAAIANTFNWIQGDKEIINPTYQASKFD